MAVYEMSGQLAKPEIVIDLKTVMNATENR
jgi:hypothetical protein